MRVFIVLGAEKVIAIVLVATCTTTRRSMGSYQ